MAQLGKDRVIPDPGVFECEIEHSRLDHHREWPLE